MPKGVKKEVEPVEEDVLVSETKVEETKPKSKKDIGSVDVVTETGKLVRSYSASQHGEDYEDLAKQFALKNKGYKVS